MPKPLQVLLISGSLRAESTNTAVLQTARIVAPEGIATALYGGMHTLPHFNPDDDREGETVRPAVAQLREQIATADALLLCTPEYAGALPGALKNLLEWTVGDAGTYRKPVALINASGPAAPTGAADAHDSLRKVLGYVDADIVEAACARIPVTRDGVGPDGTLTDPAVREEIARTLTTLARHTAHRDLDPTPSRSPAWAPVSTASDKARRSTRLAPAAPATVGRGSWRAVCRRRCRGIQPRVRPLAAEGVPLHVL